MANSDLFDTLRSDGKLEAAGEFGLDRAKAREKMQKFQLPDPHHYVLEFVQAAQLLGATEVDFRIDADEMEMHFDGVRLTPDELEAVYEAAFSRGVDRRTRALRHLAIGLSAAQALDPAVLRIDVTDAEGTTTLALVDGEEQVSQTPDIEHGEGTRIYVREAFKLAHLLDAISFLRKLRGDLAEKTILRTYCVYSDLAIRLGDERVSQGMHLPDEAGAVNEIPIETEHERGVVGIVPGGAAIEVSILQHGVRVVDHHLGANIVAARAIIDSDRLTKNLSQSAFVEDEAWQAFCKHLLPAALYSALDDYVAALGPDDIDEHRDWLRQLCRKVVPRALELDDNTRGERSRRYNLGDMLEALPRLVGRLERLPLWKLAYNHESSDGANRSHLSLAELLVDEDGTPYERIYYSRELYSGSRIADVSPTLYFPDGPPALFRRIAEGRLRDVTARYRMAMKRDRNMRAWRQRPWTARPDSSEYPIQTHIGYESLQATIALAKRILRPCRVVQVKEGFLLGADVIDELSLRGVLIQVSGDLPENDSFDAVEPDGPYLELVFRIMEEFPAFIGEHAAHFPRSILRSYLSSMLDGTLHPVVLAHLDLDNVARLRWLRKHLYWSPQSPWGVVEQVRDDSDVSPEAVRSRLDRLGSLTDRPLFETVDGEGVSLEDVYDSYASLGDVSFLLESRLDMDDHRTLHQQVVDRLVVLGDRHAKQILQRLFGSNVVDAYSRLIGNAELRAAAAAAFGQIDDDTRQRLMQPDPERAESEDAPKPSKAKLYSAIEDAMTADLPEAEPQPDQDLDEDTGQPESRTPAQTESRETHTLGPKPAGEASPHDRLVDRLRRQLLAVRRDAAYLLDEDLLEAVSVDLDAPAIVARTDAEGVALAPEHPAVRYALEHPEDPVALAFLTSSVYSSINLYDDEVTNLHEAQCLERLAQVVRAAQLDSSTTTQG